MANGYAVKTENFRSRFMDKLLMGMSWPEYMNSLVTPFNVVAALILSVGLPLIAIRFIFGLHAVTHASNDYPWGLFLGWGLFGGVPLAATGFVMATAYYIFGFKGYHPLVRLGVLTGFLGYFFAVVYLLDRPRPALAHLLSHGNQLRNDLCPFFGRMACLHLSHRPAA